MREEQDDNDAVRRSFALYAENRHDELSESLLRRLDHLARRELFRPDAAALRDHAEWLLAFLSLFVRADYPVSRAHALRFIRHNATISNLAAVCPMGNTDGHLRLFGDSPRQLGKFLALCSARNTARLDYDGLFTRAPLLANAWYSAYFDVFQSALAEPYVRENLRLHLQQASRPGFAERLRAFPRPNGVFYAASYIDPLHDRALKRRVNEVVRSSGRVARIEVRNRPERRSIAVMSMFWRANHSVYRNFSRYVAELARHYRVTLLRRHPGDAVPDYEDVFERVIDVDMRRPEEVACNDFAAIFYPDVGMSMESIVFSNLRLAPVQIAGVGHSVSGFGNQVDYFISGAETEIPAGAQAHYDERLVLIPGFGVIHNQPRHQAVGAKPGDGPVVINCSWTAQKVNSELVSALARIVDGARRDIRFQFFPGHALRRHAGYLAFVQTLTRALGASCIDVAPPLPYVDYMRAIETCSLAIDAWHYGGCNTVADCLYLGKPVVAWQGTLWNNRIGGAMLRSAGLDDLVADHADDYVDKVLALVNDESHLAEMTRRVRVADLDATVFSDDAAPWFVRAVDYLVDHHRELVAENDRSPVVIAERVRGPR